MVRYFFHISYIGTKYRGLQKMPEFPNETIQGVIEDALHQVTPAHKHLTSFASRTDKGVHALMNTFHVDLDCKEQVLQPNRLRKELNFCLGKNNHEILVTNCCIVPEHFHARHYVKWRSYLYRVAILKPELGITFAKRQKCDDFIPITLLNRCHVVPSDLDISIVKDITRMYHGEHDFTSFSKYILRDPWKKTKRVIDEIKFYEVPCVNVCGSQYSNFTMWEFYLRSASFLYHQVRKLVGTAIAAGFGAMNKQEIESILNYPSPEKFCKVQMAPACGLYLSELRYDKGFINLDPASIYKENPVDAT